MPVLTAPAPAAPSFFDEPDPQGPSLTLAQARVEDAYWEGSYSRERYYRPDCNYEDYAPAYCAGYVGYAQYGGSYEDAERSLVSNWLRIRGDSRLDLEEAGQAMRAAWRRMECAAARALRWTPWHAAASTDAATSIEERQHAGTDTFVPEGAWQRAAQQPSLVRALTAQP